MSNNSTIWDTLSRQEWINLIYGVHCRLKDCNAWAEPFLNFIRAVSLAIQNVYLTFAFHSEGDGVNGCFQSATINKEAAQNKYASKTLNRISFVHPRKLCSKKTSGIKGTLNPNISWTSWQITCPKVWITWPVHQICWKPAPSDPHPQQASEVPGNFFANRQGVKYHWCSILKQFSHNATFDVNLKAKELKKVQSSSDRFFLIIVSHFDLTL